MAANFKQKRLPVFKPTFANHHCLLRPQKILGLKSGLAAGKTALLRFNYITNKDLDKH